MNDPKGGRTYKMGDRFFVGNGRAQKRYQNNLGLISGGSSGLGHIFRNNNLNLVEQYLENEQYNHLAPWKACDPASEEYTKVRDRKPSIIFPFTKILQDRVSSKLVGDSTFPEFEIPEHEDETFLFNEMIRASMFAPIMLDTAKNFISYTSAFVRFKFVNGSPKLINYVSNYCYPEFDDADELEKVTIKFVYDTDEMGTNGRCIKRWYKCVLDKNSDIEYDNPEYNPESGEEPEFEEVSRFDHGLGFVQGQWFRWGETEFDFDGSQIPLTVQMKGFIDAINYNLSQSDSAVSYGLDPQLVIKGMTEDEVDGLIKSASKAWLLGRPENDAKFLEVTGAGVKTAIEHERTLMKRASDLARIVFHDPDKMVGSAQSGKALEILNSSLVEFVNELRPWFGKGMTGLLQKMVIAVCMLNDQGFETVFNQLPQGYFPASLDVREKWGPIFQLTIQDMQQLVSVATMATNGNIISRARAGHWLKTQGVDFGVEDWELETQIIDNQKTFGGFF